MSIYVNKLYVNNGQWIDSKLSKEGMELIVGRRFNGFEGQWD